MNNEVGSGNEELYNSFEALTDEVDEIKDGYEYEATIDGSDPDDLNPNDAFGDESDIVRDLDDYKFGDDSGDKPNDDVVEAQACIIYEENTSGFEFNSTSDKIVMRHGQLFVSVYELRNVLKIFAIENEAVQKWENKSDMYVQQ